MNCIRLVKYLSIIHPFSGKLSYFFILFGFVGGNLSISVAAPGDLKKRDGFQVLNKKISINGNSLTIAQESNQNNTDSKDKKIENNEIKEKSENTWESSQYEDATAAAEEITKGVRIEDVVESPSEFSYASFAKQDPFVPPLIPIAEDVVEIKKEPGSLEIPIISPLQKFSLSQLAVVGIWQLAHGERKAMIMTPSNQGVIVKNNDPIGNRGGKILAIGGEFITVREFFLAPDGTRQFEDSRLTMNVIQQEDVAGRLLFKPGQTDAVFIQTSDQTTEEGMSPAKLGSEEAEEGDLKGDSLTTKDASEEAGNKPIRGKSNSPDSVGSKISSRESQKEDKKSEIKAEK